MLKTSLFIPYLQIIPAKQALATIPFSLVFIFKSQFDTGSAKPTKNMAFFISFKRDSCLFLTYAA